MDNISKVGNISPAGASLQLVPIILRACSSDVLSKLQQSNSQHKAKNQSLIDRTQATRDSPLEIF